jgi:hypothetical protein
MVRRRPSGADFRTTGSGCASGRALQLSVFWNIVVGGQQTICEYGIIMEHV